MSKSRAKVTVRERMALALLGKSTLSLRIAKWLLGAEDVSYSIEVTFPDKR